ncbi:hypothetical protein MKX01_002603, partial [Papaver californicum]
VKLRCGLNNELTDVDEPSRCGYVAILSTPALCLEEKLKELQRKLDLMNMEQPQTIHTSQEIQLGRSQIGNANGRLAEEKLKISSG